MLIGIPGGLLMLVGVLLRIVRRRHLGRIVMAGGVVAPLAVLALLATGLSTLEDLSRQMSGSEGFPPDGTHACPCEGAFVPLVPGGAECACDPKGRVVVQILDNDDDRVFDAKVAFEYDPDGALVGFTYDEGMDGTVNSRCRYEPPCKDQDIHECHRVCDPEK